MEDGQLLAGRELEVAHEMRNKVAVPLIGRNPSARGVQMLQISELFQRGHLIADGRRRDSDPDVSVSVLELTGRPVAT